MREAGAPSTEEVVTVLSVEVCTPHRGSHGRATDDPAQHLKDAKLRPREWDRREQKRAAKDSIRAGAP